MTDAMRGNTDAQEAFRSLTNSSNSQGQMMRWMTQFMPTVASAGMSNVGMTESFSQWIEEWWRMMGVVPRYRYVEALERAEHLRIRLENCEKTQSLTGMPSAMTEQTEQMQKNAMNVWGSMFDETMKMQAEWMRNLQGQANKEEAETTPAPASETPSKDSTQAKE